MTGLLKDVMTERADRLDSPTIDVEAITRAGDRTVRRHRIAGLAAGTAAAVGIGVAVQLISWPDDLGDNTVASNRPAVASWAIGSDIHTETETIEVGRTVHAYVRTDVGFVVQDTDGTVWSVTSGEPKRVGTASTDQAALKADGPLAGWVEFPAGQAPQFVVFDQATGSILRNSDSTEPGMGASKDAVNPAFLYAIDGRTAYWRDTRGVVRYDINTAEATVLGPAVNGFDLADVEEGLLVRPDEGGLESRTIVSADVVADGPAFPVSTPAYLSPRATYLMSENGDDFTVFEIATGKELAPTEAKRAYWFFLGFEWLDDKRYVAMGQTARDQPVDLLTCVAATGECELSADDVATSEDLRLPTGRN